MALIWSVKTWPDVVGIDIGRDRVGAQRRQHLAHSRRVFDASLREPLERRHRVGCLQPHRRGVDQRSQRAGHGRVGARRGGDGNDGQNKAAEAPAECIHTTVLTGATFRPPV